MRQRPVAAAAINPAVPQQEREKLLTLSPKIVSRRLPGARKIPDRLMGRVGRPHSSKLTRPMKTRQSDRIPTVRLDPLARPFRDQGRCDHHAVMPERLHLAIKPVSGRPSLKADMQPLVSFRQSLDRPLDRKRTVLDIAKEPDFSGPTGFAIATACFFLATSKATKTSLYFPMIRPPCIRLGSVRPSNPRSLTARKGGPPAQPANMTSRLCGRNFD